jgi:(R)-2-hydroxyacyl-CoA dehydratese activating ATPase
MLAIGCDVGTMFTKTVVMDNGNVMAHDITRNTGALNEIVNASLDNATSKAKVSLDDIKIRGGTGMGDKYIRIDHVNEGIIKCIAKGASWVLEGVRTVVDLGGLSTTIISLNEKGRVLEYRTSDKCASGSGFFLELAAQALELSIEDMGNTVMEQQDCAHMSTQCAVFCESEIVSHINDGIDVKSIVGGINYSLGSGIATMINGLGGRPAILVTGGVAKSRGVVHAIQRYLGMDIVSTISADHQLIAAIGAALCAGEIDQA